MSAYLDGSYHGLDAEQPNRYMVYVLKSTNSAYVGFQLNLAVGFSGILIWWYGELVFLEPVFGKLTVQLIQGEIPE